MHAGSTFELPALGPYFPYFPADDTMTDTEYDFYLFKLDKHTEKLKRAFASLFYDLQESLEKQEFKKVIWYLEILHTNLTELLPDCKTMEDIYHILHPYSSFFDFEIVKLLIRKFGCVDIKQKLKKYTQMFRKYLKQRVVECPNDAFGDVKRAEKVYVIKTDKILKNITAEQLKLLQYEMDKILGNKLLRLLRVEKGCLQLTFRGVEEEEFNVTAEQQQALRNVGVLSISYGDHNVNIGEQFTKIDEKGFGK